MRLVPLPFQLWTPFAPLNRACNAQAGPPGHRALQEAGPSYQQALNVKIDYDALTYNAVLAGDDDGAMDLANKSIAQSLAWSAQEYFESLFKELALQPTRCRKTSPKANFSPTTVWPRSPPNPSVTSTNSTTLQITCFLIHPSAGSQNWRLRARW